MPEVRHGSKAKAQSDPVLPNATLPNDSGIANGTATDDKPQARPLQQPHARSADNVPVTRQLSETLSSSRLGNVLLRGRSNEERRSANGSVNGAAAKPIAPLPPSHSNTGRRPSLFSPLSPIDPEPRKSVSYAQRPQEDAYYDSRAAGRKEWKRRAKTLEEYYEDNPDLLPQLPFSWHHGNRRWRLWLFAFFVFVDASAVPIALYYGMKYAGGVEEWIIFAVVTTIWGGPTYLEFGIRTLRLIKKEHFYRPLGTTSRWCADQLTWSSSIAIFVLTTLFIIGSAPHDTWLRVVAMAAPSILWSYGGCALAITLLHIYDIPAPFRISSTPKGGKVRSNASTWKDFTDQTQVLPAVYYFMEDTLAVNGRCGRPYREAIAARYKASPRFREMMYTQSLFWSIPALILAAILTVIAVIPWVPENWSYGVCWTAPFIWCFIWGCFTIRICKAKMVQERLEWEAGEVPGKQIVSPVLSPVTSPAAAISPV